MCVCVCVQVPEMPQFVFWYHHDRMINYESMDKNRIHVFTGIGSPGEDNQQVISQLTIRNVSDADSGNYTCAPSNAPSANTLVYVSEGNSFSACKLFHLTLIFSYILLVFIYLFFDN